MQTDAISSQPVRAATPVAKLSLQNPPPAGKKNFDYHLELIMRNEASGELNDSVLKESADDPAGEKPDPAELTENEIELADGLAADQPVGRDITDADRHGLPAQAQALTISPDRASEGEFVKILNTNQDSDAYENNSASAAVEAENQETRSLEAINTEQSRQPGEVSAETGIAAMYQRGLVTQDSLVGNVRQLQKDVISELPNNDRTPKIGDKENANYPVQLANGNPQQPVSKSGLPLIDTASITIPIVSPSKEMQLLTAREVIPNTTGSLQKPNFPVEPSRGQIVTQAGDQNTIAQALSGRLDFAGTKADSQMLAGIRPAQTGAAETARIVPAPSPDIAADPLPATVSTPSPKSSGGFLTEPDSSVPISDQRWGSNTSSLAVKNISAPAGPSTFVGNVVGSAVSQSNDVATKTFFLDEGRADDIPVLSKESLTPNGPVRSAENVFSHPGTARAIASQMVDALSNAQSKKIEIALNAEELGRVRMVLSTTDAGISVSIVAERPETLDLMRRHIDQLTEELRNLGYVDIGFDFSGDGTNSRFDEGSEGRRDLTEMEPDSGSAPAQLGSETDNSTRPPNLRGLDMRL